VKNPSYFFKYKIFRVAVFMATTKAYWPLVLEDLKGRVSSSQFQAWLKDLKLVQTSEGGNSMLLKVASRFNKEYIENKFYKELRISVNKYYPKVNNIGFEVETSGADLIKALEQEEIIRESNGGTRRKSIANSKTDYKVQASNYYHDRNEISGSENHDDHHKNNHRQRVEKTLAQNNGNSSFSLPKKNIHNLNPKFTFDSLVVGSYNELASSVAKAIIKQPGTLYNPVFIYSSTGLGKTHLLQAIGHQMLEIYPSFNIRYVSSETFTNHFISSTHKGANDFRDYYRNVDLLLIDDIQFIANKIGTQEAFFHTFNELYQQNKQIIITSDRPPKSIGGIEDRLISRFEWGMVLDLSQPTTDDKMMIIKDKAQRMRLPISNDQIEQIAKTVQTNIRDIEGVLNQIHARLAHMPGRPLDETILDKVLSPYKGLINEGIMQFSYPATTQTRTTRSRKTPSAIEASKEDKKTSKKNYDSIIEVVCDNCQVSKQEILSKKRDKKVSVARQIAMYVIRRRLNASMKNIGQFLGGRDHTTVVHGCNKIEVSMQSNQEIQTTIHEIFARLQTV
jgi:chromosomal replication initiator protein